MNQKKTPYLDALRSFLKKGVTPFDVPGHHMGNVNNDFKKMIGSTCYQCDVNAPRGMDNLNHPKGVLMEAQALMAEAYKADEAFFLINGTSSGIIAMIMSCCESQDKIILPRNCHKSVINAVIISGAMPIFISPSYDNDLEIANQPTVEEYKKAILANPTAKAVFVINPTYFGVCTDLKAISDFAHDHNMLCLADEAHGAHFGFNHYGPNSAMECDCDMSAVSVHKTIGSLTQSSVLLRKGNRISHYEVSKSLSIINSTSPSTLLLASLDAARKYMAVNGQTALNDIVNLANYARKEIERIDGFHAPGREHFLALGVFDYDDTKLVIELNNLNLNGFELYNLLMDEYSIQMELAESYVLLAIVAIGSTKEHIDCLINALKDISKKYYNPQMTYPKYKYQQTYPIALFRPRTAYNAPLLRVKLDDALDMISKESIMVYPPGIPLIVPGEVFTIEIIERIKYYYSLHATVLSDYDDQTVSVIDVDNWNCQENYKEIIKEYARIRSQRTDKL